MPISLRTRLPVLGTLAAVVLLALVTGASNHAPPGGDSAGQQVAAGGPGAAGGRAALRVAAPTGAPVTSTSMVAGLPAVGASGGTTTTTTASSGGAESPGSSDDGAAADDPGAEDDPGPDPGALGVTATPGARATTTAAPDPDPVPVATAPVEPAPPSPSLTRQPGVEQEVLALTNADRANEGVAGISRDACVDAEASAWARQMADAGVMAHSEGGGASVQGCRGDGAYWGDNIGHWQPCSASSMQDWWMNSPSHRPHILDPVYDVVGIGVWSDPGGRCWFQVFFGS